MEKQYNFTVKRQCLQCTEEIESNVYWDKMGFFCSCPKCEGSFDIDLTNDELLKIIKEDTK